MTRWMRPPELDSRGDVDRFDPAFEGARCGLSREVSLAIWERICADATDSAGRRTEEVRRQFRELAVRIAAQGGRLSPDIGRLTRVGAEIDRSSVAAWSANERRPNTPGRETLVMAEARARTAFPSVPGRQTLVVKEAVSTHLGFDDYRVVGLKDLLQRLGPNQALQPDLLAAATCVDRGIAWRAKSWLASLPPVPMPTPKGQALWHAAERHAATLYRRAEGSGLVDPRDPAIESALQQCGTGQLLPEEVRRAMERDLGVELTGVRIHTDAVAAQAALALGAQAFTIGEDIFFAAGLFAPDTRSGRTLLAHELTHVAQALRGQVGPAGDGLRVSQPGEPLEREADAVANRVVAGQSAADLLGSATRGATPQSNAIQMQPAALTPTKPTKQSDFVIPLSQDSFTVSFELLSTGAGDVRVVIAPASFSRAYQSELKYWDVKGREVDKDDSYVSMGNWSVPAQPNQQMTKVATPGKFDPIDLKRLPEPTGTVWTFDLDSDGKPDFAVRIDFKVGKIFREYNFTTTNSQSKIEKFGFHFVQDDAYKYGYQGNSAPRRQKDDFVDALKVPLEMAVTMIPVIGEIVLAVEAITGRSMFGEKLSTTERVVAGVAALLPIAGGLVAKGIGRAGADLAKLSSKLGRSEEEVMALLRAIDKESAETVKIKQWEATLKGGGKLGASEVAELQRIVRQIEADERVFRASLQEAGGARDLHRAGEQALAELPPAMFNRGSKLIHTPREQALKELLEEARKADVIIQSDAEAARYLDLAAKRYGGNPSDYHAVTIGDVIFVRPQYAENVRVLREELIHVFQQRGGMAVTDIVAQEIEARLMMIARRHQWSMTVDEVKEMIAEVRQMRKTGKY
jgi:hypothetical protein